MSATADASTTPAPTSCGALPERRGRARFAAHLATCADCRREVAELQLVADALPLAAPRSPRRRSCAARIMAVVDAEAELLGAAGPEADRAAPAQRRAPRAARASAAPALAAPAPSPRSRAGSSRGRRRRRPRAAAATARARARRVKIASAPNAGATSCAIATATRSCGCATCPRRRPGRVYQVWLKRRGRTPAPTTALFTVDRTTGTPTSRSPSTLEGHRAAAGHRRARGGSSSRPARRSHRRHPPSCGCAHGRLLACRRPRWPPATATPTARPASPAPPAGGRSAPTA